jgi:uncharacterized protein YecE (DUF72 family)
LAPAVVLSRQFRRGSRSRQGLPKIIAIVNHECTLAGGSLNRRPAGYYYQYSDTELREPRAKVVADGTREACVVFNNVWMKADAARFLAMILARIECPRSAF